MGVGVVIPAAGQGRRMGTSVSKQFLDLAGEPVLIRTLRTFTSYVAISRIVVVVREEEKTGTNLLLEKHGFPSPSVQVVAGGEERQQSVYNGLKALDTEWVMVHDAVRPFVTHDRLDALLDAMWESKAAILAVPVKDTVKRVNEEKLVVDTPERKSLWAVQTPQAFQRDLLMEAHQKGEEEGWSVTDDAMLVEKLGREIKVVEGDYANLKLTTPEDLVLAEAIWKMRSQADDQNRTRV